jgi:polyferredoxin
MSQMIDINLRPDARTLRQFGLIAFFGFGFLGAIAWYELFIFAMGLGSARTIVAGVFASLAVLSLFFSAVFPKANLPIYLGLTLLSYPIGFVLSYVIMGFLFYGLITPVGLFFKLTGRDAMHRNFDREATTYWTDPRPRRGKESYFRQF